MDFGSKRAYISKRKIHNKKEKKEEVPQPPGNAPMEDIKPESSEKRMNPKELSMIPEESAAKGAPKQKSRSRSGSYSSVSDEQLDEFGDVEEAPVPKAQEEAPKSSGGFFSNFFSSRSSAEDKKAPKKPKKRKHQLFLVFRLLLI